MSVLKDELDDELNYIPLAPAELGVEIEDALDEPPEEPATPPTEQLVKNYLETVYGSDVPENKFEGKDWAGQRAMLTRMGRRKRSYAVKTTSLCAPACTSIAPNNLVEPKTMDFYMGNKDNERG